ncbi:MAG: hypothetical protein ACOYEP_12970 [Limnochordia bacterium]|jgi:hypothetical protein
MQIILATDSLSPAGLKISPSLASVSANMLFAHLKGKWSFRRFLLRRIEKVTVERGLLCIAHSPARLAIVASRPNTVSLTGHPGDIQLTIQ